MTKKILNETAGGGAVGAGGIAVRTDGPGLAGTQRRKLQDFLRNFNKKVMNQFAYYVVPASVTEAFDTEDVLSRLRGIEGKKISPVDHVTYGVEDDEGNIMKVTVRKDQAAEFEAVLAHEMAAIDAFSVTGQGQNVSMAELLYNLKDKFDIIDVQFPKIPTDVVYNADEASYSVGNEQPSTDVVGDAQTNLDDELGPATDGETALDLGTLGDEEGELPPPGEGEELPPLEGDAEGVEDFAETPDEGSILDKVLDMLKAQAEAQTAQAQAEAEKYRAEQAEYSARAAQATVAQEEELARMELEMQKQKEKEARAKKLADIAKFRVQQASGVTEGDSGETVAMVRKMMAALPQKWEVFPNDSPETRAYKQRQQANEMRELQARMRTARTREIFQQQQRQEQNRQEQPQQNNQQNNQQNQNQQGQQQGQAQQNNVNQ